jgi:hypothetical protein
MGGVFAQFGVWRWAFGSLAIITALMAAFVPTALPGRGAVDTEGAVRTGVPVWSLILLGAAALAISVAGVQDSLAATVGSLAAGAGLVGCFLLVDRRAKAAVLPRATFQRGPLKWMYATIAVLMAATMADMYVPLFGQRLVHMAPAVAGFLGAVLAVGWTLAEFVSASVNRVRGPQRPVGHGDRLVSRVRGCRR